MTALAETPQEARARAAGYLKSPGETPRGPDLDCSAFGKFPKYFSFYKLAFEGVSPTKELCEAVEAYGEHYQKTVLPYWPLQEALGIVVRNIKNIHEFNAAFSPRPLLNKQTLPYLEFLYLPDAPIAPQIPVWSHELGHAALQEMLEDHFFPIAVEAFLKMNEDRGRDPSRWQRLNELYDLDTAIRTAWKTATADEINNKLVYQQAAVGFRTAALKKKLESINPLDTVIVGPLHEFFADLFTALLHNDPNITGDCLDDLGIKTTPSDFRRFSPANSIPPKGWHDHRPHTLFTPARHYFGKHLFARVSDRRGFLRAMADFYIHLIEKPDSSLFLSYQPLIDELERSKSPGEFTGSLTLWLRSGKLNTSLYPNEIELFCKQDFAACKSEILEQLNLGQAGLFKTSVDPEKANVMLIKAMIEIAERKP